MNTVLLFIRLQPFLYFFSSFIISRVRVFERLCKPWICASIRGKAEAFKTLLQRESKCSEKALPANKLLKRIDGRTDGQRKLSVEVAIRT